jgi:hypothetical protein
MTREEITAMFDRRAVAWDEHDRRPRGGPCAPTSSARPAECRGRGDIERIYKVWFTAFPDLFFKERDLLIDNDRVALVMTVEGTHAGDFFGLAASGRRVKFVGAFVYTLRNGLIVHERRILDFTGVLVQVGVIRAKPAAGL